MPWPAAINSEGLSRTHRLVSDIIFRVELFINVFADSKEKLSCLSRMAMT
jgi:hypothetical protein